MKVRNIVFFYLTRFVLVFLLVLIINFSSYSQDNSYSPVKGIVTQAVVFQGDTIPYIKLREFRVFAPRIFRNKADAIEWTRLVRNVKKVYPYAKLAGLKMQEYNEQLRGVSKSQRSKMVREFQRQLFDEFEDEIKDLTFTQGKILAKLIDREIGLPPYDIIKDYRNGFVAGFWQTVGKVFGLNLRERYDPQGKDREIEIIVIMIENGAI